MASVSPIRRPAQRAVAGVAPGFSPRSRAARPALNPGLRIAPIVAAVAALLVLPAAARPQKAAPAIPSAASSDERARLDDVVRSLVAGRYAEAALQLRRLAPPAVVRTFVDLAPVPSSLRLPARHALREAASVWSGRTRGAPVFRLVADPDGADLLVFFAPPGEADGTPVHAEALLCAGRRTERIWVAPTPNGISAGDANRVLSERLSEAFGVYLGLSPDLLKDSGRTKEIAEPAGQLAAVRARLLELARRGEPVRAPQPAFVVDRKAQEFGEVAQGEPVRFTFRVQNRGTAPLDLEVTPVCGCTVTSFEHRLRAGGRGVIIGEVHTAGFAGRIDKVLNVRTNDPAQRDTALHVMATVRATVAISPTDSSIIALPDAGPATHTYELRFDGKEPVAVTGVACDAPFVSAICRPLPPRSSGERAFAVTLTIGQGAPVGRTTVTTTLRTSSAEHPQIQLHSVCEKGIVVSPAGVFFGATTVAPGAPVERVAFLTSRSRSFHVRRVTCADSALRAKAEAVREGTEYRIAIQYRGGWPAGTQQREVVVETDDARQPRIVVPVSASVAAREVGR